MSCIDLTRRIVRTTSSSRGQTASDMRPIIARSMIGTMMVIALAAALAGCRPHGGGRERHDGCAGARAFRTRSSSG